MSSYKVLITRQPRNHETAEIDIDKITGVKWDNISGGVNSRQAGYSLYGYIPYSLAKDLVACSGSHDFGYNQAKICIPASLNAGQPPYKEGYNILSDLAGKKPASQISLSRPEGAPPCTKRIIQVVENEKSITRRNLRETLISEGYASQTIRNALNRMIKAKRLQAKGSPYSPNQEISLPKRSL